MLPASRPRHEAPVLRARRGIRGERYCTQQRPDGEHPQRGAAGGLAQHAGGATSCGCAGRARPCGLSDRRSARPRAVSTVGGSARAAAAAPGAGALPGVGHRSQGVGHRSQEAGEPGPVARTWRSRWRGAADQTGSARFGVAPADVERDHKEGASIPAICSNSG
jgi:hypothetical protein